AGHGITITPDQWPSHHLPEKLLADRGELEGYNADNLVNALNISVANTPPYRADWKGIVERYFRLSNERVTRWLPGAVRTDARRGDPDYRLDACLTLTEFRQILIWTILEHNNHYRMDWYPMDRAMIRDQIEPYPVALWQWGLENRVGHLRTMPQEVIRLNLLPQDTASIARDGIRFRKLRYTCRQAEEEGWFVAARERGSRRVPVAYDVRRADTLYLRLDDPRQLVPCHLLPQFEVYRGLDWYEVQEHQALLRQRSKRAESGQIQADAAYQSRVAHIVQQAQERRKQTSLPESKAARLRNIRDNRRRERRLERQEGDWLPGDTPARDGEETPVAPDSETTYIPEPRQLELLRRALPSVLAEEEDDAE
ncbi:MAG: DNA-binding protein, partial [Anaerolineae bacterium]